MSNQVKGMPEMVPSLVVEANDIVLKPFQTQKELDKLSKIT